MLPSFCRQTVTRVRPGATTSRGSVVPDWTNATTKEITGCSMQPAGTSLSQDGRVLGIMDGFTCFMPADADVQAGDRIVFGGVTYEINGEIRGWPSATGALDHIEINLVRYAG